MKMKRNNFLSKWVLIAGIVITITGILHNSFAPGMHQQILKNDAIRDKAHQLTYFFVFCGTGFIFAGLLTIYSSFYLKKREKWAFIIAMSSGIFVALGDLTAIAYAKFENNPLIYAGLICAVSNIILLLTFAGSFKKGKNNIIQ